jgi:hypothetical protein
LKKYPLRLSHASLNNTTNTYIAHLTFAVTTILAYRPPEQQRSRRKVLATHCHRYRSKLQPPLRHKQQLDSINIRLIATLFTTLALGRSIPLLSLRAHRPLYIMSHHSGRYRLGNSRAIFYTRHYWLSITTRPIQYDWLRARIGFVSWLSLSFISRFGDIWRIIDTFIALLLFITSHRLIRPGITLISYFKGLLLLLYYATHALSFFEYAISLIMLLLPYRSTFRESFARCAAYWMKAAHFRQWREILSFATWLSFLLHFLKFRLSRRCCLCWHDFFTFLYSFGHSWARLGHDIAWLRMLGSCSPFETSADFSSVC